MHFSNYLTLSFFYTTLLPGTIARPEISMHRRDTDHGQVDANLETRGGVNVQMPDAHEISKGAKKGAEAGSTAGMVAGVAVSLGFLILLTVPIGVGIGAGFGAGAGAVTGGVKKIRNEIALHMLTKQISSQKPVNGQIALCGIRQTQGKAERKGPLATWAACQRDGAFSCAAPEGGKKGSDYEYTGKDTSAEIFCTKANCGCFLKACLKAGAVCEET